MQLLKNGIQSAWIYVLLYYYFKIMNYLKYYHVLLQMD